MKKQVAQTASLIQSFVIDQEQESAFPYRQLILTLYMESRPGRERTQREQVKARDATTEGRNKCVYLCVCRCVQYMFLPVFLSCLWQTSGMVASRRVLTPACLWTCASEAEMKGRSPICCGVMTVLFGGRKGSAQEQLVPRPVTF